MIKGGSSQMFGGAKLFWDGQVTVCVCGGGQIVQRSQFCTDGDSDVFCIQLLTNVFVFSL